MSEKFWGQQKNLADLSSLFDQGKQVAAVQGPAGIGKTILVRRHLLTEVGRPLAWIDMQQVGVLHDEHNFGPMKRRVVELLRDGTAESVLRGLFDFLNDDLRFSGRGSEEEDVACLARVMKEVCTIPKFSLVGDGMHQMNDGMWAFFEHQLVLPVIRSDKEARVYYTSREQMKFWQYEVRRTTKDIHLEGVSEEDTPFQSTLDRKFLMLVDGNPELISRFLELSRDRVDNPLSDSVIARQLFEFYIDRVGMRDLIRQNSSVFDVIMATRGFDANVMRTIEPDVSVSAHLLNIRNMIAMSHCAIAWDGKRHEYAALPHVRKVFSRLLSVFDHQRYATAHSAMIAYREGALQSGGLNIMAKNAIELIYHNMMIAPPEQRSARYAELSEKYREMIIYWFPGLVNQGLMEDFEKAFIQPLKDDFEIQQLLQAK